MRSISDLTAPDREPRSDNSLRGKSLERASGAEVPRTLTAHEWEQWYAEHGVPDEHLQAEQQQGKRESGWRRILRALGVS